MTNNLKEQYDAIIERSFSLATQKNTDYGDSWRLMRLNSITDQIMVKIHRIRQIEENGGHSEVSEGIRDEYMDIINYAIFALIKLNEKQDDQYQKQSKRN